MGITSVAFLGTPNSLQLEGIFVGIRYWELEYGRYFLTYINKDQTQSFLSQTRVFLSVLRSLFAAVRYCVTCGIRTIVSLFKLEHSSGQ